MLKENPAERPNIKTVCDLHKNIKSSVAKKEVQPNSPTKPTSQKEEKNNPSDSGYSSTSLPSTSATDKQGPSSPGATRKNQVKGPSSGLHNAKIVICPHNLLRIITYKFVVEAF